MKKIAVMLLLVFTFTSYGTVYSVRPAEAIIGAPWGLGYFIGNTVWGTAKGCYKAWKAPKGRKWDSFKKGFKEGTEGVEGAASGGIGGIIAK